MTETTVPVPGTISPEAQAILATAMNAPAIPNPAPDDDAGWTELGAFADTVDPGMATALALATTGAVPDDDAPAAEEHQVGTARYFVAEPAGLADGDDRVVFAVHGGSFTFGGGEAARISTGLLAANYGTRTWGMDYRQLPHHPYPAGLDDVVAVYRELLRTTAPTSIVVLGQSGGGNLAAALMLRLLRDGIPVPAALALLSPAADLTGEGDSYRTNSFSLLSDDIAHVFERYAGGADLRDPLVSPLHGDMEGFPPSILTAGTRDFLLSDTVRLHRKMLAAGVPAELHVWEGAPHGLFMGRAPEDREQVAQVRAFFESAWARSRGV